MAKSPTPFVPPAGNLDITIGNQNPLTGRFNFVMGADGDVQFDTTQAHAVMTSVIERRGSYWADPTHGSDLFTLQHLLLRTPSQAEAMALDALIPLEESNAIGKVSAVASNNKDTGRLSVDLTWEAPGQDQSTVTVEV
jgi:phage gp46-like protein